jgi:hypothetical protein
MQVLEGWHGSYLLVDFGIILHGAGTQGVESIVHTKVILREVGIVTYHRHLVTLRKLRLLLTTK